MRLLNIETLRLEFYHNTDATPPYAVLSHTWEDEEVQYWDLEGKTFSKEFQELQNRFDHLESRFEDLERRLERSSERLSSYEGTFPSTSQEKRLVREHLKEVQIKSEETLLGRAKQKKGWIKIAGCCNEAAKFGLSYVWIDTCCIFKDDSNELSEAINSMFTWYRDAELCFAYLSDASAIEDAFGNQTHSRWFSRGWTLQELVAPSKLIFYQRDWVPLGARSYLADRIEGVTNIPQDVPENGISEESSGSFSIATKMSWAAHRETTRPEDRAYSLMGLFSVNMPTLYGEGEQSAFFRLQTEIFTASGDHSIFAWCQDQFRMTPHPKLNPDLVIGDSDNDESHALNLFTPGPKMFAPRPRPLDFPVNLISRFGAAAADSRTIWTYPGIEPSQYDLKILNLKPLALGDSVIRYSASCHGMRVQLLLEHFRELTPECHIFIAHLACRVQLSTDIIGIYLMSERLGQYRRVYANTLVSIEQTYHTECPLTLEDVYITRNEADRQIGPRWPRKDSILTDSFDGAFCINVVDKELKRSGFTLREWTDCKRTVLELGMSLTFDGGSSWNRNKTKTHVLLFETMRISDPELIAVVWEVYGGLRVCVQIDVHPATTAAEISRVSRGLPYTMYPLSQHSTSHWAKRSRDGGGVNVLFRQSGRKKQMYVVIF